MKIKEHIGESFNGFLILGIIDCINKNENNQKKILLKCDNCGEELIRSYGVNFEHIKCSCRTKIRTKGTNLKDNIGNTINGLKILDLKKCYGNTKAILKCTECGKVFERFEGVDLTKTRCTCKNKRNYKTSGEETYLYPCRMAYGMLLFRM